MSEIVEHVAKEMMVVQIKSLGEDRRLCALARAAIKATVEHLRANVTDAMLEAAQVSTSRLDAFDKMLEAALGELSAHPRPTEPAEQGEA